MTAWTLIELEFSDGSEPPALLRQAADWLDSLPPDSFYVGGVNWGRHEWTGGGGDDDVLTLYLSVDPASLPEGDKT